MSSPRRARAAADGIPRYYDEYYMKQHVDKHQRHDERHPDYQARIHLARLKQAAVLHRQKYTFKDLAETESFCRITHSDIMAFKFLWIDYEPRCYWWEIIEVVRRVFQTAVLAAIDQGSKLQIAIALAVSILYTATYIRYRPFVFDDDDLIAEVAGWSVTMTLFVCLMIRADIGLKGRPAIGMALLFAAALLPIGAVLWICRKVIQKQCRTTFCLDKKRRLLLSLKKTQASLGVSAKKTRASPGVSAKDARDPLNREAPSDAPSNAVERQGERPELVDVVMAYEAEKRGMSDDDFSDHGGEDPGEEYPEGGAFEGEKPPA